MIVVIDGNIGSGKSTVLSRLSRLFKVVKEPISDWPLEEFYTDPYNWALPLQIKILQSMKKPETTCFHERCLQSSNFVFWKHLVETNKVPSKHDPIYQELFKLYEWECDVYVYLRCSPEKCFENISKRVQDGDSHITLEYLKDIHTKYEEFVSTIPNALVIDAEDDENTVYNNICKLIGCRLSQHI
jgi:deoxyadenosine/deoxycytidine kinase